MAPPPAKVLQPQTIAKNKSAQISQIEDKNSSKEMVPAEVVNEVIEEEGVADDFADIEFDGISDGDDDDDDTDGLLIPLENGWVSYN